MTIYTTSDFGKTLKKRRKDLGYTQSYISQVTGYSASFISDLENGKPTIEFGRALHLAQMLGLDINISER